LPPGRLADEHHPPGAGEHVRRATEHRQPFYLIPGQGAAAAGEELFVEGGKRRLALGE
jgi:hypothetical protein